MSTKGNIQSLPDQQPSTPIAAALHDHFANGGGISAAIHLVELIELRTAPKGRGARLSPQWQPDSADVVFALDRGMPQARVSTEAEKFRNYWIAKSGSGATKCDWKACWRNWIINAMERGYGPLSYSAPRNDQTPRRAATGSDAILAGMGRLVRRIDERRISSAANGREASQGTNTPGELDLGPSRAR